MESPNKSDSANTARPITKQEVVNLALMMFEHIEGQLSRADTKAELTIMTDAFLIAATTVLGKGMIATTLDNTASIVERLAAVFTILMFGALLLSVYYAFLAVRPSLTPPSSKPESLFYFGSIALQNEQEFTNRFSSRRWDEIGDAIVAEVYAIARIANSKFLRLSRSHTFLLVALVMWAIAQLLIACLP